MHDPLIYRRAAGFGGGAGSARPFHPLGPVARTPRWIFWAALLISLFLHGGLMVALPDQLLGPRASDASDAEEPLEVTLLPPEPLPEPEPRYVEANPEAPENIPDQTEQYSFRDQQAADQSPTESEENLPEVDGEEDNLKVVQGSVAETPPLPPGVYSTAAEAGEGPGEAGGRAGGGAPEAAPPPPPPDFLQQEPTDPDGSGSSLDLAGEALEQEPEPDPEAPIELYRRPAAELAENAAEAPDPGDGDAGGGAPEVAENPRPMPRERPRLDPELTQGPLLRSQSSASRRGSLALDATFSEFGEYERQFYAALQAGWYQEIEFFQPIDTASRVLVRFTIRADGTIHDLEVVQSNASDIATLICETAVAKRSPFRPWTREMVATIGEEKSISVLFHYR